MDVAGGSVFVGWLVVKLAVSVGIGTVGFGIVATTVVVGTVVTVLVGMPFG